MLGRLALAGLGRRPTSARPWTTKDSPVSKVTRRLVAVGQVVPAQARTAASATVGEGAGSGAHGAGTGGCSAALSSSAAGAARGVGLSSSGWDGGVAAGVAQGRRPAAPVAAQERGRASRAGSASAASRSGSRCWHSRLCSTTSSTGTSRCRPPPRCSRGRAARRQPRVHHRGPGQGGHPRAEHRAARRCRG